MSFRNVSAVLFTKSHLVQPFEFYFKKQNGKFRKISIRDQDIKIIALSILLGTVTFAVGGVIAFYVLTARYKVRKLQAAGGSVDAVVKPHLVLKAGVTYSFSGGRFGDNIMAYFNAKWVSYTKGLPLYYEPFEYSDQIKIDDLETYLENSQFKKHIVFNDLKDLENIDDNVKKSSILLTIPYGKDVEPKWDDAGFKAEIQKLIQPKNAIAELKLPDDRISVAMHVRTGGGFYQDHARERNRFPTKFPPLEFYIEGLKEVKKAYSGKKLYIHLFTDHRKPSELAGYYKQELSKLGWQVSTDDKEPAEVQIGFRNEGNKHNANVLDDFFNIAKFQSCVISDSNFAQAAAVIGNHEFIYRPKAWLKFHQVDGKIIVPGIVQDKRT
jgi:hypothetical protein